MRHISLLDRLALIGLIALAGIPFAQIFKLTVGFATFDASELIQLYLIVVFLLIISSRGLVLKHALYVAYVFTVFIIYAWFSLVFLNVSVYSLIEQTRKFLPFFVACIILLSRLYIEVGVLLRILTYSLACSALIATSIHLFFPDFIVYAFSDNEEMQRLVTVEGRMIWGNSSLAFFSISALLLLKKNRISIIIANCIIIIGLVFAQNRTLPAGLLLYYLLCNHIVFKKQLWTTLKICIFLCLIGIFYILTASDEMINLLQKRLFIGADSQAELAHSFEIGRVPLYKQYINIFETSFPIGQGLGIPLAGIDETTPVFTSDISIISFLLPFGIFGCSILFGFIFVMLTRFRKYYITNFDQKMASVFIMLLSSAVLVSLNIDLFSRNIFVIYLTVFAVVFYKNMKPIYYRYSENCF